MSKKIVFIDVKNLMAIAEAKVDFSVGNVIMATGPNGVGKTTITKALGNVLAGKTPPKPLRTGEEDGHLICLLDSGERVEWRFSKDKQSIEFFEGEMKFSQKARDYNLKALLGAADKVIDLEAYMRITAPEARRIAQEKILGVSLEEADKKIKKEEMFRTDFGQQLGAAKNKVVEYDEELAAREEEPIVKLMTEIAEMKQQNADERASRDKSLSSYELQVKTLESNIQNWTADAEAIEKQIEQLKAQLTLKDEAIEKAKGELEEAEQGALRASEVIGNELPVPQAEIDALQERINNADTTNLKIRTAKEAAQAKKLYDQVFAKWEECNGKVAAARAEKQAMLAQVEIAAEGMTFNPDTNDFELDGIPLEATCLSRRIIANLQLQSKFQGELKLVSFDGTQLDSKNLSLITEWLEQNEMQGFIEIVEHDPNAEGVSFIVADKFLGH